MHERFGEMLDMSPEARARYFDRLAGLTAAERARKVVGLSRAAREMARAGIRARLPHAGALEIDLELAARLYGPAAARALAARLGPTHD